MAKRIETAAVALDRIEHRCKRDSRGCLIWKGAVKGKGYGNVWFNGKNWLSHRLVVTLCSSPDNPLLDSEIVNHKPSCSSKACCDYYHLNRLSKEEHDALPEERKRTPRHVMRGGVCNSGHTMLGYNVIFRRGSYECRMCKNISNNISHHKVRKQ